MCCVPSPLQAGNLPSLAYTKATTQYHMIRLICMDLCLHVYAMSMTFKIYVEYLMTLTKKAHPAQMIFINTSILLCNSCCMSS